MPSQAAMTDTVEMTRMVPLTVNLTRHHYKRMKFYWRGGRDGGASRTDGIDVDLAGLGLIMRLHDAPLGRGVCFAITERGEQELALERQREIERRSPHHNLGGRLSAWLRTQGRATWENIEFVVEATEENQIPGTSFAVPGYRSPVRPDVFSMVTTRNPAQMRPYVHEVKVSRADFLADVANVDKRAAAAMISESFFYACPEGMIGKDEVPPECGLVYEHSEGDFSVVKRPTRKKLILTPEHFMNLILKPGEFNPI
ncbi:hypothetical protein [Burkholderia gladioli]|uniref:hypothetical protein n=1 Tax=Burkholderia gladioli TaxID=28095 RepID=UPI001FC8BBE4|nr:hypothetical protein [Burkholderia gladioli]